MKTLMIAVAIAMFSTVCRAADDRDHGAAPKARPLAVITATCVACHGQDGNAADGPHQAMNPRLAGQYADFLAKALREYRSGERGNAIMMGMAAGPRRIVLGDAINFLVAQPG